MSILKILIYPNKKLRKKTKPITIFDKNLEKKISNMFETLYYYNGIGLAATQVNITKSIIVIDINKSFNSKIILINPKIIKKRGKIIRKEGCLSIPNTFFKIERSNHLITEFYNTKGKKKKIISEGLLSICIQHEIDHIKGKLFIDYI